VRRSAEQYGRHCSDQKVTELPWQYHDVIGGVTGRYETWCASHCWQQHTELIAQCKVTQGL
jgi:hypothetical protein